MPFASFQRHFSSLHDKRQSAKITYPLFDVLFGSLCAVIAGAQGWFDIREYMLGRKHPAISPCEFMLSG